MWLEVVITNRAGPKKEVWRIPIWNRNLKIGKSLEDDLILFHPDVPDHSSSLRELKNKKGKLVLGPYECRVQISRAFLMYLIAGILFFLSAFRLWGGLLTQTKLEAQHVPVKLPATEVYVAKGSAPDSRMLEFQFPSPLYEVAELHFTAGNVTSPNGVRVLLNGSPIGFAPACSGCWGVENRIRLSPAWFAKETNHLVFEGFRNGDEEWGVRNIYLTQAKVEESEDRKALFIQARQLFDQRTIKVGQLWKARRLIQKILDQSQVLNLPPPKEALNLKNQIENAERLLFLRGMSEARTNLSVGNPERAKRIYERLLEEFVNPLDPRRIEIEGERGKLGL